MSALPPVHLPRDLDRDMERLRDAMAVLDDASRLKQAEAALCAITDLSLTGQLAGAAHRITQYAHDLCERAFREECG